MAIDFLSALVAAAAADAALAAAGLGTWHYGVDPGDDFPSVVVTSLGTKITTRNFGPGQIHEEHIRVNVFSEDADQAATIGAAVRAFLESLQAAPLTFDNGRQVDLHQTGEDLILANRRKPIPGGRPFVWLRSSTWVAKIARDRA